MQERPATASVTVMNEIVLPSDSNALGTAFGGKVMQWIDVCAAIAAQRHCTNNKVVTASMDELHFHAPIRTGAIASLRAEVTATFTRSLEVFVEVHSEDPAAQERRRCCSAYLTFAALDDSFKPTTVPPLALITEDTRAKQEAGEARRKSRLARRRSS